MGTRLLTLVQISDVHFGDVDPLNGDSDLSAGVPSWWRFCSLFDGYLGHHSKALSQLSTVFGELKRNEGVPVGVVVTGDLTATGKPSQFDLAKRYIEGAIVAGPKGLVGLNAPGAFAYGTIPGNHDHWPGTQWIVGNPAGLRIHFPGPVPPAFAPLPIPIARIPIANGRTLVLAGIDTSAEVRTMGMNRLFARGRFRDQLRKLQAAFPSPMPDEIRVLLLHHSPAVTGPALGIDPGSRALLDVTIQQCGISVLLTGHAHKPLGVLRPTVYRGQSWTAMEARCGTSLQRDELPPAFVAPRFILRKPPRLNVNTFLVHRLSDVGGQTIWETTVYWRIPRAFIPKGALEDEYANPIQPIAV